MFGWGAASWIAAVRDWIDGTGIAVLGDPVERLTRPWSTVWSVETADRRLWFKDCPPHRAEAGVHAAVARLAPRYVDAPVAVEVERGWLLTRDGGTTVMDAAPGGTRGVEVDTLSDILRDYAALQIRTLRCRETLVSAGLTIAPPSAAADVACRQAIQLAGMPPDDPRHITAEQRDSVFAALPALRSSGAVLAAGPVPQALDQCDLSPLNVFVPRPGTLTYRFFDFADSVWTHPFGSLVMLIPELKRRWKAAGSEDAIDCRDERIRLMLDTYLSCWTDYAPIDELRVLAGHALRLAPLHRSAAWLRILSLADRGAIETHGRTPWAWLEDVTKPVLL